ncbi:MAG TPA: DUF937 domain-containing protein [Rhodopirellula baltica]|uniref:DUF937 domain-containing protein n=1 Tax=Rhodopirellula baltica (strain DSM 10527 / NCIMB 13988 / SH1) TaxID=243090 RepID=Q7UQ13_RHOBA|nr:DUF937 domain-containing protein [Rhodopirellula baltica]CAD74893.1 conserved hypothetical protein [Rhodopirellula baltica SH 1]HBE62632.1 DUF937 domain-containing protein [Rhodopirellula baltica]
MSELLEQVGRQMTPERISSLSRSLGADEDTVRNAVSAALPTLLGAVTRQADDPSQTAQLHHALERDHDGSLLDHLSGLFGSDDATQNAGVTSKTTAGGAILDHILGNKKERVEHGVSAASGLSMGQSTKLMMILAPVLMGVLGQQRKSKGLSPDGLGEMLRQEKASVQQSADGGSMLGRMFDQDGDGDFDMMDVVKFGMGRFFGRK